MIWGENLTSNLLLKYTTSTKTKYLILMDSGQSEMSYTEIELYQVAQVQKDVTGSTN